MAWCRCFLYIVVMHLYSRRSSCCFDLIHLFSAILHWVLSLCESLLNQGLWSFLFLFWLLMEHVYLLSFYAIHIVVVILLKCFPVSISRFMFRSSLNFSSSILLRSLLDVCVLSLTFWLTWNFYSLMQWSDRKSLFVMSKMLFRLLLISQWRLLPSLCVCMCICCLRSCMSIISCMLVVSGCSEMLQGIWKSPNMLIFLELLSWAEMSSGNSSRKVSIVIGCFVEYGVP